MPRAPQAVYSDEQRIAPPQMNHSQALVEAQRCLYCFDAPCTQACPVRIDVPGFIKRLAEQNYAGSGQLLFAANPLATTCGAVCPTADLCEGACVLRGLGQRPIRIGALQYLVASQFQAVPLAGVEGFPYRVAIIGGGPSGLGCAATLRRLGCTTSIYERTPLLGGLANRVIPAYRLPQGTVEHDVALLEQLDLDCHLQSEIDRSALEGLLRKHDAIFLGIGLSGCRGLAVPGGELAGVVQAIEFLGQVRAFHQGKAARPEIGETVVVIGGGNVALDAAVTAKLLGAEQVLVLYRRSMEEMPAWSSEYVTAASVGVEFRWLSKVEAIQGDDRRVQAVQVQPMRRTGAQSNGRRGVEADSRGLPYLLRCDTVLLALGQVLDSELAEALALPLTQEGTLQVDPVTYQTGNPKVFAGGETVSGAATVVSSLAVGMTAGRAIHRWLPEQGASNHV